MKSAREILDRCQHFYGKVGGGFDWPNSREGDLIRMAHGVLTLSSERERELVEALELAIKVEKDQYVPTGYLKKLEEVLLKHKGAVG